MCSVSKGGGRVTAAAASLPMSSDDRRFVIRWILFALGVIILALMTRASIAAMPAAQANPGNFGPGPVPGLCDYPAVCDAGEVGAVGAAYWYSEDWPTELNGSHRHCYYFGGGTQGSIGFSMMLQVSATGPVGGFLGGCHYVCPSGALAEMPNPPGGWKDAIIPTRCKSVGPNPDVRPEDVPIAPPIAEQGAIPPPLPGPAPSPPLADSLPSQTLPVCGNPDATTNTGC